MTERERKIRDLDEWVEHYKARVARLEGQSDPFGALEKNTSLFALHHALDMLAYFEDQLAMARKHV